MASASASVLPPIALGSSCSVPSRDFVSLSPAVVPSQLKSSLSRSLAFCPLPLRPTDGGRAFRIVAMATGETSDPSEAVRDVLKSIQEYWDGIDDKLAVGGLGFTALIVLWAVAGLIGWFIYRFLLFKPDREDLAKKLEDALGKITGSEPSI